MKHFQDHLILDSFAIKSPNLFLLFFSFSYHTVAFFSPEITQDSENSVLKLSGKARGQISDKNTTNKIHKKYPRCPFSDPGGYPR